MALTKQRKVKKILTLSESVTVSFRSDKLIELLVSYNMVHALGIHACLSTLLKL